MKGLFFSFKQWYIYHLTKRRKDMLTEYKKEIASKLGCDFSLIQFHKTPVNYVIAGTEFVEMEQFGDLKPDDKFLIGYFTVLKKEKDRHSLISSFTLFQLPHCCAYMMSCHVSVGIQYRGKGIGRILNRFREAVAKAMGYSAILCTDIHTNYPQRLVLAKNGWSDVHSVLNKRTGNKVMLSIKNISNDTRSKSGK